MGSIAINENIFRSHSLGGNRCCSLAMMAKPPLWFSDITGNKWPWQLQNSTGVNICVQLLVILCVSNESKASLWSPGSCLGVPGAPAGLGELGSCGVGTAPPAGEPPAGQRPLFSSGLCRESTCREMHLLQPERG